MGSEHLLGRLQDYLEAAREDFKGDILLFQKDMLDPEQAFRDHDTHIAVALAKSAFCDQVLAKIQRLLAQANRV